MEPLPAALEPMVAAARDYCRMIEAERWSRPDWLVHVADLLPRLHAAVTALRPPDMTPLPPQRADLDRRFELFSRLRKQLGCNDGYWLEYDHWFAPEEMSGSLADDLTDIYFDLKQGLEWLDCRSPERAARTWQSGYRLHWGEHLVDAERQLYRLVQCRPLR